MLKAASFARCGDSHRCARLCASLPALRMYEAAAAALESFREHDCSPGAGSELEVEVRTAVTHTTGVKKLREWAGSRRKVTTRCRYQAED
jgi:hypothetical protein